MAAKMRGMALTIAQEEREGVPTLSLSGDLDVHTKEDLEEALEELMSSGATVIRLDLTQVDYVGSVAIAVMVSASKRLARHDGKLLIKPGSRETRRHFGLLNLDMLLDIEE